MLRVGEAACCVLSSGRNPQAELGCTFPMPSSLQQYRKRARLHETRGRAGLWTWSLTQQRTAKISWGEEMRMFHIPAPTNQSHICPPCVCVHETGPHSPSWLDLISPYSTAFPGEAAAALAMGLSLPLASTDRFSSTSLSIGVLAFLPVCFLVALGYFFTKIWGRFIPFFFT